MISPISAPGLQAIPSPAEVTGEAPGAGEFQKTFADAVRTVEGLRGTANRSIEAFLSGESEELHQTVLATQRAELSFELFLQVRNKVVQAYQEVMRMQV